MIDRKTAPPFQTLRNVTLPKVHSFELPTGRKVFYLNNDNAEVFKIDIVLRAGSWHSSNYHLVPLTLKMLNEGTKHRTGSEIANAFDGLGSFTEFAPGFDQSTLGLYGLSKFFSENLKLLSELLLEPAFDDKSFNSLKSREIQRKKINLEKSSYKASVMHRSNIFGPAHPYGAVSIPEDTEAIELAQCMSFYERVFSDFDIMLSGRLPQNFQEEVQEHFGNIALPGSRSTGYSTKVHTHIPEKTIIERNPKFVQSSIRIGRRLFNRSHADYMSFMVLNEVLGGYFGSRLMKNIREDKGFTYGIYSQLYSLNHDGFFSISTDVDTENENRTIEEIHKEMEHLRNVPIPQEELDTVKNYMTGTFAGSVNSPFSIMDKFKATYYQGLSASFYDSYIELVDSTTSDDLLGLAQKHLALDSFSTVIVGH